MQSIPSPAWLQKHMWPAALVLCAARWCHRYKAVKGSSLMQQLSQARTKTVQQNASHKQQEAQGRDTLQAGPSEPSGGGKSTAAHDELRGMVAKLKRKAHQSEAVVAAGAQGKRAKR
jgi:hypothetical protein